MIKKFFTAMLGSLAAIWVSVIILVVLCIGAVGGFIGSMMGSSDITPTVKDNSVLWVDLSGNFVERAQGGSLRDEILKIEESSGSLDEYLSAIRLAAKDAKIKGAFIDCQGASLGTASRQELVDALEEFATTGKWILSYGDAYSQGDYMVGCAADEMYVNPVGMVDIHGIASSTPYFKNLLDKIGVEMQIVKVGRFKSAVEPFILTSASEPSILQTRRYIDGIWQEVSGYIADRRGVTDDSVRIWAENICSTLPADSLVEMKVVDRMAYRREVEKIMKTRCGIDSDDDLPLVRPAEYMAASGKKFSPDKRHIAVLYAVGDIVDKGSEGIVGETMTPLILSLAKDENVAGLVLRVNSGGGSAFASEQIWEALQQFKAKDKPFFVSMGDVAASGGYYISCGADRIFADPATLTGSIGIFGMVPCLKTLLNDKIGVNFTTVSTNANADFINVFQPMTPRQHDALQKSVERGYETFVGRVAKGRGMEVDSVKAIAEGRVWYGRDALAIGLVDSLAPLRAAVDLMAREVHLKPSDVVAYPEVTEPALLELIRSLSSQASLSTAIAESLGADPSAISPRVRETVGRLSKIISQVAGATPVQARAEDIIIE